jgi:hypothetical protein
MKLGCLLLTVVLIQPRVVDAAPVSELSRDERIVFYPTFGARAKDGTNWTLEIHGRIYEPERGRLTLGAFREALELKGVELTTAEEDTFKQRARLFAQDNERGHRVVVRVGSRQCDLGESAPNGHFTGTIRLTESELGLGSGRLDGQAVPVTTVLRGKDKRSFMGEVLLLGKTGMSVISDIDDTIKITEVRDRRALLRNTFLREFQAAPGMAEFYQTLARSNRAVFHFVSGSPWQLYAPLADFARSNGFPTGTFHLRQFRWKDRSFFSLFSDPEGFKTATIEPLLKQFPNRRFMLIGDSGERDPEIYGELARRHPRQIAQILIRDVTGEPATSGRYQRAFARVPIARWQIFREPREIKVALE